MMGGAQKNSNTRFARTNKELLDEKRAKKTRKKVKLGVRIAKIKKRKKREIVPAKQFSEPRAKAKKTKEKKPKLKELSKEYGLTDEDTEAINERINQSKRLIIISGVSFFMVLVVVFWLFNTKYLITKVNVENDSKDIAEIWTSISAEMQNNLEKIKTNTEVIDNLKGKLSAVASSTDEVSVEPASTSIKVLPIASDDLSIDASSSIKKDEVVDALVERLNSNF